MLQYRWLKLLAGGGATVMAVGDDDQSIYAFRGAEVGNMRDFEREFRVENVIRLEQNYRSHGNILDAANAIIKNNAGRLGKNLWTDRGSGEPIRMYEAMSDIEEARWVVDEIRSLAAEGTARREIALLYRSNAQSRVLEHALFSANLPYRVYGGLRFFERQEIKHALAYLRLIANPDDDTAFARVVNFPTRGIGARSLEQLQDAAKPVLGQGALSLWAAAKALPGKAGASVGGFVALIEKLRAACAGLTLPETVEQVHRTLRPAPRTTRPRRKARTASPTSTNWSMPPSISSPKKATSSNSRRARRRSSSPIRSPPSWPMPRSKPASTRPAIPTTRCS